MVNSFKLNFSRRSFLYHVHFSEQRFSKIYSRFICFYVTNIAKFIITSWSNQAENIEGSLSKKTSHQKLKASPYFHMPRNKSKHWKEILAGTSSMIFFPLHWKDSALCDCKLLVLLSHQRCYIKITVLKNIAKFTGKHLCQSNFFNKVAYDCEHLLYKTPRNDCFFINISKYIF